MSAKVKVKKIKRKTNSSAKKRFSINAAGEIKRKKMGKRHGMTKRSNKQIRQLRKSSVVSEDNIKNVLKYLMPNG